MVPSRSSRAIQAALRTFCAFFRWPPWWGRPRGANTIATASSAGQLGGWEPTRGLRYRGLHQFCAPMILDGPCQGGLSLDYEHMYCPWSDGQPMFHASRKGACTRAGPPTTA